VRLPFPLRTAALAGALMVTLAATGGPAPAVRPVWLSGAQTAAGYTDARPAVAGQTQHGVMDGAVIQAAAGTGHAFGWQTAGGKGSTSRLWRSAEGATFSFTGTPDALTVQAADFSGTAQVTFTAPKGRVLEPGTFATGDGSKLTWLGVGTCVSETHTFTISTLTWAADGTTLTALDATFAGSCGTSAKGRVLVNFANLPAPATAAPVVTAVYARRSTTWSSTPLTVAGTVVCGGSSQVFFIGRIEQGRSSIPFTARVDCVAGATVAWTVSIPGGSLRIGGATYRLSGSLIDGFYRYARDVLVKNAAITLLVNASLPRR
jgi:hypothetical protein